MRGSRLQDADDASEGDGAGEELGEGDAGVGEQAEEEDGEDGRDEVYDRGGGEGEGAEGVVEGEDAEVAG